MPDQNGIGVHGVRRAAAISECGRYRWWLRRSWRHGGDGRQVCFVMLNPSSADAFRDDPTIRRCMGFARTWGFSTLSVRNLFAWRTADPAELLTAEDPIGEARGDLAMRSARSADLIVAAWGADVPFGRDRQAIAFLVGRPLYCLGITKTGQPRHPLYVRSDTKPQRWEPVPKPVAAGFSLRGRSRRLKPAGTDS